MAKEWQVATDNGNWFYTLKLDDLRGTLVVKEGNTIMAPLGCLPRRDSAEEGMGRRSAVHKLLQRTC